MCLMLHTSASRSLLVVAASKSVVPIMVECNHSARLFECSANDGGATNSSGMLSTEVEAISVSAEPVGLNVVGKS